MGWNSWNKFECNITDQLIRDTADTLVSLGFKDAGYEYVNLDDCWHNSTRNPDGSISPDPIKFPSGMLSLSRYVHSKGLKFGLYSDAGSKTCAEFPGGRHFEKIDAKTYASWEVDYLKYDNCFAPAEDWVVDRYTDMRDALNSTGRTVFFSLCEWGVATPWHWAQDVGNSWRTDDDIKDNWDSFLRSLDNVVGLSRYAGPGGWNDPDMLEVGNGGMTENEYRAHFSLWALLKAPLLIGCDLTTVTPAISSILLNRELISWNQDPLGVAGDLIWKEGPAEVYAVPLADGSRGVVFFNRQTISTQYPQTNISIDFTKLGYAEKTIAKVIDAWTGKTVGEYDNRFTASVNIHDGAAYRIVPVGRVLTEEETAWKPWDEHAGEPKKRGEKKTVMIKKGKGKKRHL